MFESFESDEPFILASQATQVYYVPEVPLGKGWHAVVQNKKSRDPYAMTSIDDETLDHGNDNEAPILDLHRNVSTNIDYQSSTHARTDIDGIIVDAPKK